MLSEGRGRPPQYRKHFDRDWIFLKCSKHGLIISVFFVGLRKLQIGQILDIEGATYWTEVKTTWFRSLLLYKLQSGR